MSQKRLKASRYRYDRNRGQNLKEEREPQMNNVEEKTIDEINESVRNEPELETISTGVDSSGPKLGDILPPELKNMTKENDEKKAESTEDSTVASETSDAETKNEAENESIESKDEVLEKPIESPAVDDPDRVPVSTTYSDDDVPNRPGAILMHAREILGLSQREVAHKLNLRVNSVSDIEHDRLNQPTALQFASVHIANYAKLVNINPDLLVDLYKENVRANVQLQEEQQAKENKNQEKGSSKKNLKIAGIAAALAVVVIATAGITASIMSKSNSQSSGALVIQDTVEASVDSEGTLLMDTENSKMKTNVIEEEPIGEPVDMNTYMAQEQSKNLNTDAIIDAKTETQTAVEKTNTNISLKVKGEAANKLKAGKKVDSVEEVISPEPNNTLKSVALSEKNTVQTVKAEENKLKMAETKAVNETLTSANKDAAEKTQAVAEAKTEKVSETKKEVEVKSETESKPNVALSASTHDVSSSVRLNGKRDPFESMNTVNIRVTGDVALRVTGNGKVLKDGTFKSGQTLKVTGIPPLKVSVSDSSKVRISYMGTSVSVPNAKQVSFALPTR